VWQTSLLDVDAYAAWLPPRLAEKLAPLIDRRDDYVLIEELDVGAQFHLP